MPLEALKKHHAEQVAKARQVEKASKSEQALASTAISKLEAPISSLREAIEELKDHLPEFSLQQAMASLQQGTAVVEMAKKVNLNPESHKLSKVGVHASTDIMAIVKQVNKTHQLLKQLGRIMPKENQ